MLRGMLPHAVFLDMDGTLVDSESVYTEAVVRYMASKGVELDERERSFIRGHAWQDIYAELRVHERLGVDLPTMQAGTDAMRGRMRQEGLEFEVLGGARELVETLVGLEVPVMVVSGSSRAELAESIALLGIGPQLRCYYGSEDYPRGKPAPDGYQKAAAFLGVEPSKCMVFEDSEVGIGSGLAAGMRVVATRAANEPPGRSGHQDQSRAHRIVDTLTGIDAAFLHEVMQG